MERMSNQVIFQVIQNQDLPFQFDQGLLLFFGLQGSCHIFCANTSYEIRRAGLLVINPFELYRLSCPAGSAVLCLKISRALLEPAGWQDTRRCLCYAHSEEESRPEYQQLRRLYAAIFRDFFQSDGAPQAAAAGAAIQLVSLLRAQFSSETRTGGQQEATMQRLKHILDFIHAHWNESFSLGDIAAREYLSTSYLSRFFQKHLHVSFSQYVMELRLRHAAHMLTQSALSVTHISYDCGFRTPSTFIEAFKQQYDCTPGQYRRKQREQQSLAFAGMPEQQQDGDVSALVAYLPEIKQEEVPTEVHPIAVSAAGGARFSRDPWRGILNIGYARDVLLAPVQQQICRAQREIGYEYIRFHGLFDADMHIYQQDAQGRPYFDFTYVDLLFDFILSVGLKPFVEFSFMPSVLAREQTMIFDRPTVISGCVAPEKWHALVRATVEHFTERYGREAVRGWRFSTITQSYVSLNCIAWEDYRELHRHAHQAVKEVDSRYLFAGPGWFSDLLEAEIGLSAFVEFAREQNCLPDLWSMQCNPHLLASNDPLFMDFTLSQQSAPAILSKDADVIAHAIDTLRRLLTAEGISEPEIVIIEGCSTLWQRDLSNDTCYKSAWLVKNLCENGEKALFGYWLLTDMIEERASIQSVFHGGYGLLTYNGIPKAGYRAMQLLRRMGDERVASGEGWLLTRRGEEYQLMTYNYCHYSNLYRYRYKRLEQPQDAYSVFDPGVVQRLQFHVQGLPDGTYRIERHAITRANGSSFDSWLTISAPAYPSGGEIAWLSESRPFCQAETVRAENGLRVEALLHPLEVQLLTFRRRA